MHNCPESGYNRYFNCRSSVRNHLKIHNNTIGDLLQEIVIAKDKDKTDGFLFNNSKDIEPKIENNIIDEITDRLEDNKMNYEINKDVEVDEIEETNRLEISYNKEKNNETNEIDEANN
ncbi:15324_t:CDS:2, partial [Racocetra fulgida]